MKTMKLLKLLMVLPAFTFIGCEKDDTKSTSTDKLNIDKAKAQPSGEGERRGGNGNGNGQGNGNQVTDPCANYPVYPIVNEAPTDWNIKVDTTICGMVIFKWDAQPGFNPVTDTCYTIARYYYISIAPEGHTNGCVGGGSLSGTNSYYYILGAGCSIWPGYKYSMAITYVDRSEAQQKSIWHSSL